MNVIEEQYNNAYTQFNQLCPPAQAYGKIAGVVAILVLAGNLLNKRYKVGLMGFAVQILCAIILTVIIGYACTHFNTRVAWGITIGLLLIGAFGIYHFIHNSREIINLNLLSDRMSYSPYIL